MTNILGPYYSPWHWRGEDETYIRELDPAWVRIHQPTARAIHVVHENAPNAKIMLRSWDIDDNNGERKREMYADPKGAAVNHLALWNEKLIALKNELRVNGWAYDESKWWLGLVNEPDPAYVPQVVEYSLEAMRLAALVDLRVGVVASSVGTFSKPGENDHGWVLCKPLEKPINDGGHILIVHEYWQPEGPNYGEDAGNLAWRHRSIPLNVPILIGESGANGYIYGRYSKSDDAGWQKTVKDEHGNPDPDKFAAQVKEYIEGCDERVQGVLLYMLDYHSSQWYSFDTQPAMRQLLAVKGARPQRPSPFGKPSIVHLPSVSAPEPVEVKPVATNIIEPRVAQAILKIESGGRTHGDDGRIIVRFEPHIFAQYVTPEAFAKHFQIGTPKWNGDQHRYRDDSGNFVPFHGNQVTEYRALNVALELNSEGALKSISMGAGQIMGFNHARVGFPTAAAMFQAFQNATMQAVGFMNYFLSDPVLMDAMHRKDWRTIAAKYNGTGAVDTYAPLLERAYNELGG